MPCTGWVRSGEPHARFTSLSVMPTTTRFSLMAFLTSSLHCSSRRLSGGAGRFCLFAPAFPARGFAAGGRADAAPSAEGEGASAEGDEVAPRGASARPAAAPFRALVFASPAALSASFSAAPSLAAPESKDRGISMRRPWRVTVNADGVSASITQRTVLPSR